MKTLITRNSSFAVAILMIVAVVLGCGQLTDLMGKSDKLYFCEKYTPSTDNCEGESTKYTTGTLTVMAKLKEPIGVTNVNINISDKATGEAVDTFPFTVSTNMDYIYFDDVAFREPGNYKVSLLKEDGTVIVSNDIEIVD